MVGTVRHTSKEALNRRGGSGEITSIISSKDWQEAKEDPTVSQDILPKEIYSEPCACCQLQTKPLIIATAP